MVTAAVALRVSVGVVMLLAGTLIATGFLSGLRPPLTPARVDYWIGATAAVLIVVGVVLVSA